MGAPPLARQTPAVGLRTHAGSPATVAFRRPSDDRGAAAGGQHFTLPVVLRLPDLNAPAKPQVVPAVGGSNPLVGKLMWVATGVLAVVAVWLVATGKQETPPALPTAPSWNSPDRAATAADPLADAAILRPVPNWKSPHEAGTPTPAEESSGRGPWRAGAQVIQPGATAEAEAVGGDKPPAPGSASWPGDAWPGRRPDAVQGREPAIAPPGNPNLRDAQPAGPPALDPTVTPGDPWPSGTDGSGGPQWPDDARRGGDPAALRTAQRPAAPNTYAPQQPQARLEGGIQNMNVSPSNDSTR